jgi:aconitase A
MTPEERATFDEKQISILELERSNIKSHLMVKKSFISSCTNSLIQNLLSLSKTLTGQSDADTSNQKKSFKISNNKTNHDTSIADKVSESKKVEEEEDDDEEEENEET